MTDPHIKVRNLFYILSSALMAMVVWACSSVPSHVIDPDDMAEIMADIYVAECVVDQNHYEYSTDSLKLLFRQSIFAKHGVTTEDFDTSMVWYGHNLDKYIDVYDRSIKLLEARNQSLGSAIVQSSVSMAGDSVDVWNGSRYAKLNDLLPSQFVTFALEQDDNWEPGDQYTWRVKLIDEGVRSVRWTIVGSYDDGSVDWLNSSTSVDGWNEVVFASDSTRTLTSVKGIMELSTGDVHNFADEPSAVDKPRRDYWIDSISLVRKRVNPTTYSQRYRLRHYDEL